MMTTLERVLRKWNIPKYLGLHNLVQNFAFICNGWTGTTVLLIPIFACSSWLSLPRAGLLCFLSAVILFILTFKIMKEMYLFLWSQHEFWSVIWAFYRAAKDEKSFRICTSQFSETWSPNSWDRTFFFDTFTDSVKRMENTSKDFLDF